MGGLSEAQLFDAYGKPTYEGSQIDSISGKEIAIRRFACDCSATTSADESGWTPERAPDCRLPHIVKEEDPPTREFGPHPIQRIKPGAPKRKRKAVRT